MLSASIMMHPSRKENLQYLQEKLGDVPVAFDKINNIWDTCRRAWMERNKNSEYHVVIQDDAIVCDNFYERALSVIEESGRDKAISFYYGKRGNQLSVIQEAMKDGHIIKKQLHWGVAVCLRTEWIDDMLSFANPLNFVQDDYRIGCFLRNSGIKVYYPLPSLIDHRSGVSLVGDPGKNRHAFSFIDNI